MQGGVRRAGVGRRFARLWFHPAAWSPLVCHFQLLAVSLGLNAVQHSESQIGAFGLIQFYESEFSRRFVVRLPTAESGSDALWKGTRLSGARLFMTGRNAIELALEEGISGTGSKTRGIGLFGIAEDMRQPDRQLIIHSGIGMMLQTGAPSWKPSATRTQVLFPGTLVSASIPT